MPDIGKVDDLLYGKAVVFKCSPEYIGEHEHRKIADMLEAVHCRAAVIHAHDGSPRREREFFLCLRQSVVKI